MAGFEYKPLFQVVGTTSAVQAYISPASTITQVTQIKICNTTANWETATIYHDIDGVVYDDASTLEPAIAVPPYGSVVFDTTIEMTAAVGGLAVKASANTALTFTGYGWQFS